MSAPAPGRYCLAVCYCGECAHYKPIIRHDPTPAEHHKPKVTTWDDREESTWIDKL